jgi:hypothetical protein
MLKSPLNIYIVWHPEFIKGADYANFLYSELCRNYQKPMSRDLGIPVFFRSEPFEKNTPVDINFELADRNAVVILAEDEMFEDDSFSGYFKNLVSRSSSNSRIFPVALKQCCPGCQRAVHSS